MLPIIMETMDLKARKILFNSTGTKQIVLISSGVISDGRNNATDRIIKKIKELKNNNIKIQLYQVSTTYLNNSSKYFHKSFKHLSDETNTKAVVLNPNEYITFFKNETRQMLPITIESPMIPLIVDEYLNEFFNNGETKTILPVVLYYGQKDSYLYRVNFYSYCNQTCIIVPFDIGERKFYDDKETLEDIFRSKDAVELVKSGGITESAYVLSNRFSDVICGFFDSDSLNEQAKNLLGEKLPSIEPKTKMPMKILKWGGYISKVDYPVFIVSGECKISNGDELLIKIINGGRYTYNLKNGYAYNGITRDFQIYNKGIMDDIEYRKTAYLGVLNVVYMFNVGVVDNAEPMVKNNNIKLTQLLNQDYKEDAESAINRINYKSEESQIFINYATSELNDLNSQIPYTFTETVLNFIEEPETDYSMAKLKQANADVYLNKAKENRSAHKFNSANQDSNYSMVQSKEGMVFANIEKSKERFFKNWVKIFGIIVLIFLVLIIMSKPRQK